MLTDSQMWGAINTTVSHQPTTEQIIQAVESTRDKMRLLRLQQDLDLIQEVATFRLSHKVGRHPLFADRSPALSAVCNIVSTTLALSDQARRMHDARQKLVEALRCIRDDMLKSAVASGGAMSGGGFPVTLSERTAKKLHDALAAASIN